MPIPGSILGGMVESDSLRDAVSPNAYPSRANFYAPTTTVNTTGQKKQTFAVMDAAHQNIPCRRSPLVLTRPQDTVKEGSVAAPSTSSDARFHLSCWGYFTDVLEEYRVTVDGVIHRIVGVEWDGNNLTTRFLLSDVVPFNI